MISRPIWNWAFGEASGWGRRCTDVHKGDEVVRAVLRLSYRKAVLWRSGLRPRTPRLPNTALLGRNHHRERKSSAPPLARGGPGTKGSLKAQAALRQAEVSCPALIAVLLSQTAELSQTQSLAKTRGGGGTCRRRPPSGAAGYSVSPPPAV